MSGNLKLGVYIFAGILALYLGFHIVHFVMGLISILVPLLVVIGIGALIYTVVSRKSLGSGRRRILP